MSLLSGGPRLILFTIFLCCLAVAHPVSGLPLAAIELCKSRETIIWQLLLFFAANYFSHAATVPTTPGARLFEVMMWAGVALFLPFACLGRSLAMIMRHVQFHENKLEKAASQGAVVVVARRDDWFPDVGPEREEEEISMHLPTKYNSLDELFADLKEQSDGTNSSYPKATFDVRDHDPADRHGQYRVHYDFHEAFYDIHGEFELPDGYMLAVVTLPFLSEIMQSCLDAPDKMRLSKHKSFVKKSISIAQIIAASYVLYQARGDQLNRFGYAAYGLTVFPYAIMSLVNFIADAILGEYPSVYVLNTPILNEAKRRGKYQPSVDTQPSFSAFARMMDRASPILEWAHLLKPREAMSRPRGIFNGAVGRLKEDLGEPLPDLGVSSLTNSTPSSEISSDSMKPVSKAVSVFIAADATVPDRPIFKVRSGDVTRRCEYVRPSEASDDTLKFVIGSVLNKDTEAHQTPSPPIDRVVWQRWVLIYCLSFFTVLGAPYLLIGLLTHFKAHCSKRAERGWTMAWLAADQISFLISLCYFRARPEKTLPASTVWRPSYFVCCAFLSIVSIGGMVEVGKMYLYDNGFWEACEGDATLPACNQ